MLELFNEWLDQAKIALLYLGIYRRRLPKKTNVEKQLSQKSFLIKDDKPNPAD